MRGLLEARGVRTFGDPVRREDVNLRDAAPAVSTSGVKRLQSERNEDQR